MKKGAVIRDAAISFLRLPWAEPAMIEAPNIAGKDYFTEEEAAHYACVSESQFRQKRADYGLQGFWWMGKKVYRKADIREAIENTWQKSPVGAASTPSHGRARTRTQKPESSSATESASAGSGQSQGETSTPSSQSKNTNSAPGQSSSTSTVVPLRALTSS